MHINYLRSLNRIEENQFGKSRKLRPITDDIFSQMPTQDTSYVYDSFVVNDDEISFSEIFY